MKALVFSNVWVSFCAASFSLIASKYFDQPSVFGLLFGGTLFLYCFHRMYKFYVLKIITHQQKETWMVQHKSLYFGSMIFGLALTLVEFVRLEVYLSPFIVIGIIAALVSLLYVVRIRTKNLREIPYTKILWVTLTYVAFTSLLGFEAINLSVFRAEWQFFLSLWLIVLGITLMFDLRDKEVDELSQKTWPQLLGYRRSQGLSFLLYGIGTIMLSISGQHGLLFASACLIIGFLAYAKVHSQSNELNYSFYFEGVLAMNGWIYFMLN